MPRQERNPCSGWGFARMIASTSASVAEPIFSASRMRRWRPLSVASVCARHVFRDRGVPVPHGRERVAGDARAAMEISIVVLVILASTTSRMSREGTE